MLSVIPSDWYDTITINIICFVVQGAIFTTNYVKLNAQLYCTQVRQALEHTAYKILNKQEIEIDLS
jgi:hypothetical protein